MVIDVILTNTAIKIVNIEKLNKNKIFFIIIEFFNLNK